VVDKRNHDKTIVIAGDVTADWNIARLRKDKDKGQAWNADDTTRVCFQPGGAAMLADVVEAITERLRSEGRVDCRVSRLQIPEDGLNTRDCRYHHSYAMWAPKVYSAKETKKWVWRVEEFLGLDPAKECDTSDKTGAAHLRLSDDPVRADVVVLDDANLGFRERKQIWPKAVLGKTTAAWIVCKVASPVAQGALWEHLIANCASHTIAVMTVNDLRRTEVNISRGLSWERTAQDLFWELTHNPMINGLSRCAHVIVSVGTAGVLRLSQVSGGKSDSTEICSECKLFFDPKSAEASWGREYPGGMIGYNTCLAASITRELILQPDASTIDDGIQSGMEAMRTLHIEGYGSQHPKESLNAPTFPVSAVVEAMWSGREPLQVASVQDPVRFLHDPSSEAKRTAPGFWTILDDVCSGRGTGNQSHCSLNEMARSIVVDGLDVGLEGIPLGKFGGLTTADRHEIEGYRSIHSLMVEYSTSHKGNPLCIAVFGPPGSGKSYGVKQVAKSITQVVIEPITFNLSQFNDPAELVSAFHQIRDISLSGKMPLVFWDEFDATLNGQKTGWLRYFLSPMQDGEFQDAQITYHIGRAIFVFAGGTRTRIEKFDRTVDEEALKMSSGEDKQEAHDFKDAKGPDFVSRLNGFVNILGPNRLDESVLGGDEHFIIRRAVILRQLMQRHASQFFSEPDGEGTLSIDSGLLRAFLQTSKYKHGVRSMEAIITMSTLSGRNTFERSCLPSEAQLNLHVDGLEFLAIVQQPELDSKQLLDKLARANHEVYCVSLKGKPGAPAEASLTYDQLSEHLQDQNEDAVRDIPSKLSSIGHVMIPARSDDPPFDFPGPYLEQLSEAEHTRWLKAKLAAGWRYGDPPKSNEAKTNPAMCPWQKLSDEEIAQQEKWLAEAIGSGRVENRDLPDDEKDKDRELVRGIPKVLALAGYTIVDLRSCAKRS